MVSKSSVMLLQLVSILQLCTLVLSLRFPSFQRLSTYSGSKSALGATQTSIPGLGGKIVVTGIGKVDEDEFALTLINEQSMWSSVILGTDDAVTTKKRFLSRTARYSGLLNVLDFATVDLTMKDQLTTLLEGANSWIAFNVTQESVPLLSEAAVAAGVKRAVFTVALPLNRWQDIVIPELDQAISAFEAVGASLTGIRHGIVVEGDENNPYEIVNATVPCLYGSVERGVLARVATELLLVDKAENEVCGLSSGTQFAAAYLDILRSSGLNRQQEVTKMYVGGLQRVAKLTVATYEAKQKAAEEKAARKEQRLLEEALELEKEKSRLAIAKGQATAPTGPRVARDGDASITPGWDEEEEFVKPPTNAEKLAKRSEEILKSVWKEYDTRMYAKSTSKGDFFDQNRKMAMELAQKEYDEELALIQENDADKEATQRMMDQIVEVNRKQYAKLLSLERKEMQNQKEISDTWVKYIYLLIETTLEHCKETGKLFHNIDEYAQTLLLRQQANVLRQQCNLPPYDVIYDPLDASVIVTKLSDSLMGERLGLASRSGDEVGADLTAKHGQTLKSVSALRGASQIIELAIETLKMELPPPPPSVNEMRRSESLAKQQLVSQGRLEGIKNRGKPKSDSDDTGVGRM